MKDHQTQKVIDDFFKEVRKKKKLEHLKMWKNQNKKNSKKQRKQNKKKGYKVR